MSIERAIVAASAAFGGLVAAVMAVVMSFAAPPGHAAASWTDMVPAVLIVGIVGFLYSLWAMSRYFRRRVHG